MELEAFTKAFQEVFSQGMVRHDGKLLLWFPNFLKYNLPESPNVVKSWRYGYDELPESELKIQILIGAKSFVDGLSEAFQKAFEKAFAKELAQPSLNQRTENREQKEEDTYVNSGGDLDSGASADVPLAGESASDSGAHIEKPSDSAKKSEVDPKVEKKKQQQAMEENFMEGVAGLYNRILVEEQPEGRKLPKLMQLQAKRKGLIRSRMKGDEEFRSLEGWEEYFNLVSHCPLLMGETTDWKAGFDWLLNVANMLKVREGNYLPNEGKKQQPAKAAGADLQQKNADFYNRMKSKR